MDEDKLKEFRQEISELRACGLLDENLSADKIRAARKTYKRMTDDERAEAKKITDAELTADKRFTEMLNDDIYWNII